MRKLALFLAAAVAALGLAVVGPSPVDAQATTAVYAVHGLNLDGQSDQAQRGTPVTVCVDDTNPPLIADFQFGDVGGPVEVPTGASVNIKVYPGANQDCENPGPPPLIDQTIDSVPAGTVALVATSMGEELDAELVPIPLNTECVDPGTGRLTGVHAANAPTVDVLIDGAPVAQLSYGEKAGDVEPIPVGTYTVQIDLSGNPIVGPTPVEVLEANNRIIYVVGNQTDDPPTPVVPLIQDLALETCETPTEPPAEQQPRVVQARPTFTG